MEVDSSIEVFDLSLQRGAPSSISEEASSFSYEYFLENHHVIILPTNHSQQCFPYLKQYLWKTKLSNIVKSIASTFP